MGQLRAAAGPLPCLQPGLGWKAAMAGGLTGDRRLASAPSCEGFSEPLAACDWAVVKPGLGEEQGRSRRVRAAVSAASVAVPRGRAGTAEDISGPVPWPPSPLCPTLGSRLLHLLPAVNGLLQGTLLHPTVAHCGLYPFSSLPQGPPAPPAPPAQAGAGLHALQSLPAPAPVTGTREEAGQRGAVAAWVVWWFAGVSPCPVPVAAARALLSSPYLRGNEDKMPQLKYIVWRCPAGD